MPLCDHIQCDWMREREQALCAGDADAQREFNEKFTNDLEMRAYHWLQDSHDAETVAANAIRTFLMKTGQGQLSFDPCPMSYLATCLRRERYAIWRGRFFVERSCKISSIRGEAGRTYVKAKGHQLCGDETLEFKETNCEPAVKGVHKTFTVIDESTIELPIGTRIPGNAGTLRVLKLKSLWQTQDEGDDERRPLEPMDQKEQQRHAFRELQERLDWALSQLPKDEQSVMRMSLQELSRTEMADALEKAPHQIDYLKQCAIERLKRIMGREESSEPTV